MLSPDEIATLQGQKQTYYDMGYNNILESNDVKMPNFISSDDFAALTEGFKGGLVQIDTVKGQIIIKDREGTPRILMGNDDS